MRIGNWRTRSVRMLLSASVLVLGACDDPFDAGTWSAAPDTLQVWSISRVELQGFASALDLAGEPPIGLAIESPTAIGAWDVALMDVSGGLALVPSSFFPGHTSSRAAIAVITDTPFAELERAPGDTAAFSREPVPLTPGGVYVVRTRIAVCGDGGTGVHYAKLRPLVLDAEEGRAQFELVNNPFCNRDLIPPE